jgi:5S rRNA maturation endonuclease (ribonuclease M5)
MREHAIRMFLEALGVERISITEDRGWVNCPCPLAPYTHAGGSDTRPSFGIKIDEQGPSVYWCFGCSPKGHRLDWLLHSFFVASGMYPREAAHVFLSEELLHTELDEDSIQRLDLWVEQPPKQVEPLPPKVLKKYPLLQRKSDYEARSIRTWLEVVRGIPEYIQNLYRLRYNYHKQTIIFPLTDSRGNIFVLRERMRKEKRMWTVNPELAGFPNMDFPKLKDVGVWFGMMLVDWSSPVIVVEGEIDVMKLSSLGFFNAIGSATSSVSDSQIDALTVTSLILGFDADKAGNFARNRIIDRMRRNIGHVPMYDADWSLATKEDGSPCKDPGDIPNREQLLLVLNNLESI